MKKVLFILCTTLLLSGCLVLNPTPEEPVADLSDVIVLTEPTSDQAGACPLHVEGSARGSWYFEASFPAKLLDANDNVIAQAIVTAQSNWMTSDFVPFAFDLYYATTSTSGTLVLENSNPSGLPENALKLEVPVKLESCSESELEQYRKETVEKYLRDNIVYLSPVDAVLGGTWYVLSVEFIGEDKVKVLYEDGHIQESFEANYTVSTFGTVELEILED